MNKKLLVLVLVISLLATNLVQPTVIRAEGGAESIVLSHDFEDGDTSGWQVLPWGGSANVTVSDSTASSGTKSLLVSERSARDAIPFLNLTGLGADKVFNLSFKVKIGEGTDSYHLSSKIGAESLSNQYPWLAGSKSVGSEEWVVFEATNVTIPADATEFMIWLEADGDSVATADIYIDELVVVDVTPAKPGSTTEVTRISLDFEDSQVGGWQVLPWGGTGDVAVTDLTASSGLQSLQISNRSARNTSPFLNLTDLGADKVFNLSFKVKLGEGTDSYHLSSKIGAESLSNQYPWLVGSKSVGSEEWVVFEATNVTIPADATEFMIWLEADGDSVALADIYIDEFVVVEITSVPEEDDGRPDPVEFTTITFEDLEEGDFSGFVPRGGTEILSLTEEDNHTEGGAKALKIENRSETWHAPSLRVETNIKKGYEYLITAWVKLVSPGSSQLQLSTQVGNGDGASYNNIQGKTITTEEGWVKFEGKYRYSSVGDEYVTIYVESSNNATAVYLIDDISFVPTDSGKVEVDTSLTKIKEVYQDDFLIGTAVAAKEFEGQRLVMLNHHYNVVTAENAMKPVYAYDPYPTFNFDAEDALVTMVKDNSLNLVGHTLVWHQQSEEALHTNESGEALTREVALENLTNHITTVVQHFGDQVISWDVVNEAMNDNPANPSDWRSALRASGWLNAIGDDYVEQAFLIARQALDEVGATDVKLYYNDYNDDNQNKAEAIYQMVKEINADYGKDHDGKKLIDGIGMQAHYNLNTNPENVEKSLLKFIEVTNEVSVTELDITAGSNNTLSEEQAIAQGYLYATLMTLYKEHADHIARVTFWGLDDATSWRAAQNPLLFDGNLQAKLAYEAVIDPETFLATYEPEEIVYKESQAAYGKPTIDGTIDAVWSKAAEIDIDQYQLAWQGASGKAKVLWDDAYLYVLVNVSDSQLDKTSANPWEQDSVEIFVDSNNGKTSSYEGDDGQYRVNYDNETSFNPSKPEGFASATKINGSQYIVEARIPFKNLVPSNQTKIGFDVQINDGQDGQRQSVATWNDLKGTAYMDTSVFGNLTLTGKPVPSTGGTGNTSTGSNQTGNSSTVIEILEKDIALSPLDKTVLVQLANTTEAKVEVKMPLQSVLDKKADLIQMTNDQLSVKIPMDNFSPDAKDMNLVIEKVQNTSLKKDVQALVGNAPVYDFNLTVDGKKMSSFKTPVTLSFEYDFVEGMDPLAIVVYYISDQGELEIIPNGKYDQSTGMVTFTTDHFSHYTALVRSITLKDVSEDHWSSQGLSYLAVRDIIKQDEEGKVEPAKNLTRGELVGLLVEAFELESGGATSAFSDIEQEVNKDAINIAASLDLIKGYEDESFGGTDLISREDLALILYRYLQSVNKGELDGVVNPYFEDQEDVSSYAEKAVSYLKKIGIVVGYEDETFRPKQAITKAEAAALISRIMQQ